jgi:hypothetical protein
MVEWNLSDAEFDRQFDEAVAREGCAAQDEPRAKQARVEDGFLAVTLIGDASFRIPLRLVRGLPQGAPLSALAEVEVSPSGEGLLWPRLGASLSVPGLLIDLAGPERVRRMVLSGAARKAAGSITEKRSEAARKNGAKGGRPRKQKPATGG